MVEIVLVMSAVKNYSAKLFKEKGNVQKAQHSVLTMLVALILLLGFFKFNCLRCEIQESPGLLVNSLDENDQGLESQSAATLGHEFFLPEIISSISIDNLNNALIVHFRKLGLRENGDEKTRLVLDKNFMRFGRGDSQLMRFGKRQLEFLEAEPEQGRMNEKGARDSRGDNFMRFGRSDGSLMRFGRGAEKLNSKDTPLEKSSQGSNFDMSQENMRLGRADNSMMRFGRAGQDLMRFGRSNDFIRFGRPDSFMRLGRTSNNQVMRTTDSMDAYNPRYGRNDKNFMRFGKLDQNFMRFGKRKLRSDQDASDTIKSTHTLNANFLENTWKPNESMAIESKLDSVIN